MLTYLVVASSSGVSSYNLRNSARVADTSCL